MRTLFVNAHVEVILKKSKKRGL